LGVTDFVRDVDYKPGEIVPHCGCTLDVFVGEGGSVTVSDKPVERSCALVEVLSTSNGLTCYRLALGAGHRVKVQASGWRDIETAPKDGTVVLVYVPSDGRAHACWWDPEYKGIWDEKSDDLRYIGAWTDGRVYSFGDEETYSYDDVTHWMPLPLAPSPTGMLTGLELGGLMCGCGHCSHQHFKNHPLAAIRDGCSACNCTEFVPVQTVPPEAGV
jgi:hypothetical protein